MSLRRKRRLCFFVNHGRQQYDTKIHYMEGTENPLSLHRERRTTMNNPEIEVLTQALAAPFDPREVKFKPAVVSGNRAMALAYIDARVIQDRLDSVVGVLGWQDEYECL